MPQRLFKVNGWTKFYYSQVRNKLLVNQVLWSDGIIGRVVIKVDKLLNGCY